MQIFLFFALSIAILAVAFALQNSTPVQVSFITWKFDSSLALVLLIALGAGALISFFLSLPTNVKARWIIRKQQKKMTELEAGIADANSRMEKAQDRVEMLEAKMALVESRDHAPASAALPPPPTGEVEPETTFDDSEM